MDWKNQEKKKRIEAIRFLVNQIESIMEIVIHTLYETLNWSFKKYLLCYNSLTLLKNGSWIAKPDMLSSKTVLCLTYKLHQNKI